MDLPIDLSVTKLPIKDKYIDEETQLLSRWQVFGVHNDGTVDITDSQGNDVFTHVPPEKAVTIITAREDFVNAILWTLNGAHSAA